MDTVKNDNLRTRDREEAERSALRNKLTASAMLALSPEAAEELARDFDALRIRLDAVVRSEAAQGEPPAGPIHTEVREVLLPDPAAARTERDGDSPSEEGRGRTLLQQAAQFDGAYAVVPRVV